MLGLSVNWDSSACSRTPSNNDTFIMWIGIHKEVSSNMLILLLVDWAEQLWNVKRRRRDIFRDTYIWCFSRQNTAIQHSSLIMTWLRYTMKNWSRLHLNHYGLWTIFASNIVSEILIFIQSLPFLKNTAQKIKFCITDFFSKWDQIRSFLRIGHIYWRNL